MVPNKPIDRPDDLKEYAELYETGPGWTFLTGEWEDIEVLRKKLGAWDRDPIIDQDKTQHAGILIYGSEPLGRGEYRARFGVGRRQRCRSKGESESKASPSSDRDHHSRVRPTPRG